MEEKEEERLEQPLSGLRLLRLLGIDIYINRTWLIIFALVAWNLAGGYFPAALPGLAAGWHWLLGVLGALLLFACVLAHELAHSVVARRHGLPISGITLFLFGGVSNLTESPHDPATEFKVAVVGPLSSLLLAGLFYLLFSVRPGPPLTALLAYLAVVNLLLAVFNVLPGFPLDGGRILRAALWWKTRNLTRSTLLAASVGAGVGWGLVFLGLLRVAAGDPLGGVWLVVIGLFLRSAARFSADRARRGQEV